MSLSDIQSVSFSEIMSVLSTGVALSLLTCLCLAIIYAYVRAARKPGMTAAQAEILRAVHDRLVRLADPPRYVTRKAIRDLERDAKKAVAQFPFFRLYNPLSSSEKQMLKKIRDFLKDPDGSREKANDIFFAKELTRSREFFDRIETRPLTDEQRRAVIVEEERNLVVAAAGSGKTSVIVAKAGWLLRRGYRRPSELLLLAFAKDAQEELEERIRRRLGDEAADGLTVRTFHSLGLSIIGEAEGKLPTLAKVAEDNKKLSDLLKVIIEDLLAEREFGGILLKWFQSQFAPYRSEHEFRSYGEYWDYVRRHEIRSLKGDKVKSFEECEIANFLYMNGVSYEYERPYEHDTATSKKRQYLPDFYLPEAGVYIEHFGLDAAGNTASFVNRKEYLRDMDWKCRQHKENGTTLIETFSHERNAGKLIENLAGKLTAQGVTLSPIPCADVFAVLEKQGRIDPFTRLVATFLQHYKEARLSFQEVAGRAAKTVDRQRAEAFMTVFRPIFERYQETLSVPAEIDFHDMINRATELVESGRYGSRFDYILVDEFQDISPGRAKLLKALLGQSSTAQVFAVGDDWQSIYRFAGSDTAIMREFGEHFGENERINLETTFRCSDRIAAVATEFILRNPAQIRKNVRSTRQADGPSVHIGFPDRENLPPLMEALNRISDDAAKYDGTSTVLLLGRYRHTRPQNMTDLAKRYRPGLRLSYKTVHGSKGLEADYVVVLDLCSGKHGFPTEIADDPLLDLVLAAPDMHPNAEERRLLYVAITRARRHVFLLADAGPPSSFVLELIEDGYDVTVFGRLPGSDFPCPRCVKGYLERRENSQDKSVFYGCSNWPYCGHTQPACPACGTGLPVKTDGVFSCGDCGRPVEGCPDCGGWLQTKTGKYGHFLGCSNWPACDYKRNIRQK